MIVKHDSYYCLEDVFSVVMGEKVVLDSATEGMLNERRAQIVDWVTATQSPSYGFNRGFGHNVDQCVDPSLVAELQENLIRSHAAGVGPYAAPEIVRATMFLRVLSLCRGHSGVRPILVKTMSEMLNRGVTPCVPWFGSVGASGDLAPLSHIALVMLKPRPDESEDCDELAWIPGEAEPLPARRAMARVGLDQINLDMKEGLALNNGATFSTAVAALACLKAEDLVKTAALSTALTAQVMLGSDTPFRADLHALRPHPGAMKVASWVTAFMAESPMREAHRPYDVDGEIQDPYSIRCSGQILGSCQDLLDEARKTIEIEVNSTTDNPLLFADSATGKYTEIVSGGHFHGMPIAVKLYNILSSLGIIARLSNMRCVRFVDGKRNKGLNDDLKWRDEWQESGGKEMDSISSGMMIPEYVSASLTNTVWGACMPSHLFSLSTDAGQEDHVSMSATLAQRLWDVLPRVAEILAIELCFASQAAAIRKRSSTIPSKVTLTRSEEDRVSSQREAFVTEVREVVADRCRECGGAVHSAQCSIVVQYPWSDSDRRLSPPCEAAVEVVQTLFPVVTRDRYMSRQIREVAKAVFSGQVLRSACSRLKNPLN